MIATHFLIANTLLRYVCLIVQVSVIFIISYFIISYFIIYSFDLMISARVTCRFIHTLSNIKRDSFTLFL